MKLLATQENGVRYNSIYPDPGYPTRLGPSGEHFVTVAVVHQFNESHPVVCNNTAIFITVYTTRVINNLTKVLSLTFRQHFSAVKQSSSGQSRTQPRYIETEAALGVRGA